MLEDIRDLYLKALVKEFVRADSTENAIGVAGDIKQILFDSLLDFEHRIKEAQCGDPSSVETVYLQLSPFEAFKHRLRDTEAYVMTKYRERKNSRITPSSSGSLGDTDGYPVQALRECYTQMVEGLHLQGTVLLDQLVQDSCLDDSDVDSIKCKPTDRKKNEQLLHIVSTRLSGEKILNCFIPALNTDHVYLADNFRRVLHNFHVSRPPSKQCPHCRLKGTVDPKYIAEILYSRSMITENELKDYRACHGRTDEKWTRMFEKIQDCSVVVDALQPKYPAFHRELKGCDHTPNLRECTCNFGNPDVISIPGYDDDVSVFDSTDKTIENAIPAYPMSSTTHGVCVIIHNTEYKQEVNADNDVNKIDSLFSSFGFVVERITNLTKRHIVIRLEQIAATNHSNYDAFVCVIALGGTDRDHVCDVSAESVHIAYLVAPFRARSCPTLAGKPKIFLLPYASGPKRTPGLVIKEPVPLSQLETKKTVIPEDADILYARGTLPGYTTSSCKRTGSWYINNLLEVMDRHAQTLDFVSCLAMVNDGVGRVEYTKNDVTYTQTSHITSTLRKAVYLRKKSRPFHEEMEHIPSPVSDTARL